MDLFDPHGLVKEITPGQARAVPAGPPTKPGAVRALSAHENLAGWLARPGYPEGITSAPCGSDKSCSTRSPRMR